MVTVAALPLSIVLAPITAAVFAGVEVHARLTSEAKSKGDISPESDSEI